MATSLDLALVILPQLMKAHSAA